MIGVVYKHQFNIIDERSTKVNITIENCEGDAVLEGKCLELTIKAVGQNSTESPDTNLFFPSKLRLRLKQGNLTDYMSRISNYSFMTTMVIILSFFTMLGVIKQVTENHALASSISPMSIGINLIWNFVFFAINFQFSIQGEGEFMQYLGLPAFWYFISSFTFESRLFILVWRA